MYVYVSIADFFVSLIVLKIKNKTIIQKCCSPSPGLTLDCGADEEVYWFI